jgi:hypothetical protein
MSSPRDFLCEFAREFASIGIPVDETLYSFGARVHRLAGGSHARTTAEKLFAYSRIPGIPDLAVGLSHLESVTGGSIAAALLTLRQRTVLGPYLALMNSSRKEEVLTASKGHSGSLFKSKAGFAWNAVSTRHPLRFCPRCRLEQAERGTLPYWRACHQWPGVEVCPDHCVSLSEAPQQSQKAGEWLLPDMCTASSLPSEVPLYLLQVASCVCWLASHSSLSPDILTVMIRMRLNRLGATSGEIRFTVNELRGVAALVSEALSTSQRYVAFQRMADRGWIQAALRDRRTTHPLRFAVLLALGDSCNASDLDRDYCSARDRMPELALFPVSRQLRSSAPPQLYEALGRDVRIAEAVVSSGIPASSFRLWLKKDPFLQRHWKDAATREKSVEAAARIIDYLRAHPSATRSDVLRGCGGAARYLQTAAPEIASSIIPRLDAKFSRQRSLF